jgi:hypothetical protein
MAQYGPFFHGPAGVSIPVGVPAVIGIGWWMYRDRGELADRNDEQGMKDEGNPPDY